MEPEVSMMNVTSRGCIASSSAFGGVRTTSVKVSSPTFSANAAAARSSTTAGDQTS